MRRVSKAKRTLLLLAVAIVTALVCYLCLRSGKPAASRANSAEVPLSVSVAQVQRQDLPLTLAADGRAEARASVAVKARLDGQVAELAYVEGQMVHKGQLLLRIDPALLEAQSRQAQGVLARDEAQLARAQADYQRNLTLTNQGFISQSSLNQSLADMQTAQANLKADRAALDSAHLQLGYARIYSPMDGVAGALLMPVGGAAKANDTTLLVINQVQPIFVTFSLPESQLMALKAAQRKGPVRVSASVDGMEQPRLGKLTFIDNTVDPTTGAITVKALFPNADGALTPGQFARVQVQLDTLPHALVVPAQAVESGVDGPYAFVINADASVSLRQLKLGPASGTLRVVTDGLNEGERIVTTGQARLRESSKVVVSATPATEARP